MLLLVTYWHTIITTTYSTVLLNLLTSVHKCDVRYLVAILIESLFT